MSRDELTQKEHDFLNAIEMGLTTTQAVKRAGYKNTSILGDLLKKPHIASRMKDIRENIANENKMTRDKVMEGIAEAIDMAKLMGDPQSMIRGWSEVAKMCGYYAPEKKELKLSVGARRLKTEFESLPQEELLKLASEEDAIDGEFWEEEDNG